MNYLGYLFILCATLAPVSLKGQRYLNEYAHAGQQHSEQYIKQRLMTQGWRLNNTIKLTTDGTSQLLAFNKKSCKHLLYINILGSSSSEHHLLEDYLKTSTVRYILDGQDVRHFIQLSYYIKNIHERIDALLSLSQRPYSALIALHLVPSNLHCDIPITHLRTLSRSEL